MNEKIEHKKEKKSFCEHKNQLSQRAALFIYVQHIFFIHAALRKKITCFPISSIPPNNNNIKHVTDRRKKNAGKLFEKLFDCWMGWKFFWILNFNKKTLNGFVRVEMAWLNWKICGFKNIPR